MILILSQLYLNLIYYYRKEIKLWHYLGFTKTWYSDSGIREVQYKDISTWRSRYDKKEQFLLNDYKLVIRNLKASDMIPAVTSDDTLYKVSGAEEHRPDIIANKFYKDPRLAWVILAANGLKDIFDFKADLVITIPSMTSLYMVGGVLNR